MADGMSTWFRDNGFPAREIEDRKQNKEYGIGASNMVHTCDTYLLHAAKMSQTYT